MPQFTLPRALLLLIVLTLPGCQKEAQMQTADAIFGEELNKRGIK